MVKVLLILLLYNFHDVGNIKDLETFDKSHDLNDIEKSFITIKGQHLERNNWNEILPKLSSQVPHGNEGDVFDWNKLSGRSILNKELQKHGNEEHHLKNHIDLLQETAWQWVLEGSHESIEVRRGEAAENVDGPPVQVRLVVLRDTDHVQDTLLAQVLRHVTVALLLRSFYHDFVAHREGVVNHEGMELARHDTVSLLSLSVDKRPGDLDILLLLLNTLILRVLKRNIQIIFILTRALVVVFLEHEGCLGVLLCQGLFSEHSLRDSTVGVDHFILSVKLLQTIEVNFVATLLFLSII